ncbi:hypothetical protein PINS_up014559 [Pythium insidiosum]|nr:hypothetical protein PINS_up014559 [Pythium insidiosum]
MRHPRVLLGSRSRLERIRVSRASFALLWLVIFLARCLMFVYLSALAVAYWLFATPIADNTRDTYRLPRPTQLRITGLLFGGCGLLFGWNVIQMTSASLASLPRRQRVLQLLLWPVRFVYHVLLSPHGLFGIHHPRFMQMLFLRELVENITVALLVINCWSTMLVQWLVPRRLSMQRVLCLTVDAIFDFVWAVALPCWLLLFYALEWKPSMSA